MVVVVVTIDVVMVPMFVHFSSVLPFQFLNTLTFAIVLLLSVTFEFTFSAFLLL